MTHWRADRTVQVHFMRYVRALAFVFNIHTIFIMILAMAAVYLSGPVVWDWR